MDNSVDYGQVLLDRLGQIIDMTRSSLSGGELRCCCPYHGESTPSCFINLNKGLFKCFGCNKSGTVRKMFKDFGIKGCRISYAPITKQQDYEITPAIIQRNIEFKKACRLSISALHYLKYIRELDVKTIDHFGLTEFQLTPENVQSFQDYKNFLNKIVIPYYDDVRSPVGFIGRSYYGEKMFTYSPKSSGFYQSKSLYNYDSGYTRYCILTEGQFDAIQAYQAGLHNTFGLGTNKLSAAQQGMLKKEYPVILALDSDRAGIEGAQQIMRQLKDYDVIALILPVKDLDEYCRRTAGRAPKQLLEVCLHYTNEPVFQLYHEHKMADFLAQKFLRKLTKELAETNAKDGYFYLNSMDYIKWKYPENSQHLHNLYQLMYNANTKEDVKVHTINFVKYWFNLCKKFRDGKT